MADLQEIEWAFEYVSSNPHFCCRAIYVKENDCVYTESDMTGEGDIPEDLDWDHCVEIPHKNDLDLGRSLVFEFAEQHLPDELDRIGRFFSKAGAYARFKNLLEHKGLLQDWYEFENTAEERAVKEWCKENGIGIQASNPPAS